MKEFDLVLSEYITQRINEIVDGHKYIFYTALFGNVDKLNEPEYLSDTETLYICFTDRDDIKSNKWHIINVKSNEDDRISAKYWKFFGYKALESHCNYSIWVDASILIKESPFKLIEDTFKKKLNTSILTFHHPQRDCAYDEMLWIFLMGKDSFRSLLKTWIFLKNNHFSCGNGLIAGTVLARKSQSIEDSLLDILMKEWWYCVKNYSSRDQLTFNFLAEKRKFSDIHSYLNLTDNVYNCLYFKGTRVVRFNSKINPNSKVNIRHKVFHLILSIRSYIKNKL